MGSWATSSIGLSHHIMNIDVTLLGNRRAYWDLIPTYPELVHTRSSCINVSCVYGSALCRSICLWRAMLNSTLSPRPRSKSSTSVQVPDPDLSLRSQSTSPPTSPSPRSSKEASELAKKHPKPSSDPARTCPDRLGLGGAWGGLAATLAVDLSAESGGGGGAHNIS